MSTSSIKVNGATKAINALVLASISYSAALEAVRFAVTRDSMSKPDAQLCLCLAFVHHKPSYAAQFDKATGKFVGIDGDKPSNTALYKAVKREMAAMFDAVAKPQQHVAVPAAIAKQAAILWAMCAEYEGAAKLLGTALANAKAVE